jgi:hypothetical protein
MANGRLPHIVFSSTYDLRAPPTIAADVMQRTIAATATAFAGRAGSTMRSADVGA